MTDGLIQVNEHARGKVARERTYQSDIVREIRARATTLAEKSTVEERKSMRRLNQVLDQDPIPRTNVPRGFYLNIEV